MAAIWLKSIPYLWPKQPKNHTLWRRTYLYSPYKGVPPPPPPGPLHWHWTTTLLSLFAAPARKASRDVLAAKTNRKTSSDLKTLHRIFFFQNGRWTRHLTGTLTTKTFISRRARFVANCYHASRLSYTAEAKIAKDIWTSLIAPLSYSVLGKETVSWEMPLKRKTAHNPVCVSSVRVPRKQLSPIADHNIISQLFEIIWVRCVVCAHATLALKPHSYTHPRNSSLLVSTLNLFLN